MWTNDVIKKPIKNLYFIGCNNMSYSILSLTFSLMRDLNQGQNDITVIKSLKIPPLRIQIPLSEDDMGIYDYGGLNDFFIDIVENFQFYKREKYRNETDMLFDCLNGMPINEM